VGKEQDVMTELIVALRDFAGLSVDDLRDWPPAAFDSLRRRLWLFFWNSLAVLVGVIAFSFVTHMQAFIPYVGLGYVALMAFLAWSRQTLHGAGLLLSVDAALDILKGAIPVNRENIEKLLTLGTDMKRLKEFATLQLVGRFLFNALLLELLILATIWIVPIWVYPGLLGPVAFLGTICALLSTPWGRTSPFAGLRGLTLIGIIALIGYTVFGGNASTATQGTNWVSSIDPLTGIFWAAVALLLAIVFIRK
jgi:hypothetical protein